MRLHGSSISNFYNVVKWALLEKEIAFEEVLVAPSQEEIFLEKSPMGKIPVLETDEGFISESLAILSYLEKLNPGLPLFPENTFVAARGLQIHLTIDMYIDATARPLYGAAFFGNKIDEQAIETGFKKTRQGFQALARLARFAPYINGPSQTHADLAAGMTLPIASATFKKLKGIDLREEIPEFSAYMKQIEQGKSFQKVMRDYQKALVSLRNK